MTNTDKVLAELARRRELAAKATKGPWSTIGDPVDPASRILIRGGDATVATVYEDYNNAKAIADSGTHRARELLVLEAMFGLVDKAILSVIAMGRATLQSGTPPAEVLIAECEQIALELQTARDSNRRFILGDGGEG